MVTPIQRFAPHFSRATPQQENPTMTSAVKALGADFYHHYLEPITTISPKQAALIFAVAISGTGATQLPLASATASALSATSSFMHQTLTKFNEATKRWDSSVKYAFLENANEKAHAPKLFAISPSKEKKAELAPPNSLKPSESPQPVIFTANVPVLEPKPPQRKESLFAKPMRLLDRYNPYLGRTHVPFKSFGFTKDKNRDALNFAMTASDPSKRTLEMANQIANDAKNSWIDCRVRQVLKKEANAIADLQSNGAFNSSQLELTLREVTSEWAQDHLWPCSVRHRS